MFIRNDQNRAFLRGAIMLRIDITRNITCTPSLARLTNKYNSF